MRHALHAAKLKLEQLRTSLSLRSNLDADGAKLQRDVHRVLAVVERSPPPLNSELVEAVNEVARLGEAFRKWSDTAPHTGLFADRNTPTPNTVERIRVAQRGPDRDDEVTMTDCPACSPCGLCEDARMVPVDVAAEWQILTKE